MHGSGSGGCSGYPVHEGAPQELPLAETPGALLTVVSVPDLTAAEIAEPRAPGGELARAAPL